MCAYVINMHVHVHGLACASFNSVHSNYACVHVCMCLHVHVCVFIHVYVHICVVMCLYLCVCVHACV